jgi:peptidoglycan/LPS O-acetylase OafA/YrhL
MAGQSRRVYDTLDGLRAAGAQLVVMRHVPEFFGGFRVPESFLAVDLFYLVSGLVLANAYGERLKSRGMGLGPFFVTRLIRLFPLYLVGLLLGLAAAVLNMQHDPHSWWTPFKIIEAMATGLLLIPMFQGLEANGSSLDGPTWTLLPELVANMAWAWTIRWVRFLIIGAALVVCGAGVVLAERHWRTLDVGYLPDQLWGAIARAGYSFFAGVVVFWLVRNRRIDSRIVPWLCVAVLTVVLALRPGKDIVSTYEIAAVLIGFPALIALSALFEPGPKVAALFALLGRASWGVYILHEPVARLLDETVLRGVHFQRVLPPAVSGIAFLAFVTFLAWALDRWFEVPVRKVLTRVLLPKRAEPQRAA